MTKRTLDNVMEAQDEAKIAQKQLDDAIEKYASARALELLALQVHNNTES